MLPARLHFTAIATCAVRIVEAIFNDKHEFMPASVYLEQFGTYIGYPAVIGRVRRSCRLSYRPTRQKKLAASAKTIKEKEEA